MNYSQIIEDASVLQINLDDIQMKTLLQVYETYRDNAKAQGDGYGFLYWASRCKECLSIMESMKDG